MLSVSTGAQRKQPEQPCAPQFLLRRHTARVTCVAFGPARSARWCDKLVSSDSTGLLLVWDMLLREVIAVGRIAGPSAASSSSSSSSHNSKKMESILSVELHELWTDGDGSSPTGIVLAQTRHREIHVIELIPAASSGSSPSSKNRHGQSQQEKDEGDEDEGDDEKEEEECSDDNDLSFTMIPRHCVQVPQHGFCRFASYVPSQLGAGACHTVIRVAVPHDDISLPLFELSYIDSHGPGDAHAGSTNGSPAPGGKLQQQQLMCNTRGLLRVAPEVLSSASSRFAHAGEAPRYGQLMSVTFASIEGAGAASRLPSTPKGTGAGAASRSVSSNIAVAVVLTTWESGHVAVFGLPAQFASCAAWLDNCNPPPLPLLQVVHRCFPSPAMAAVLSQHPIHPRISDEPPAASGIGCWMLVVASADGNLHGYGLRIPDAAVHSSPSEDLDATAACMREKDAGSLQASSIATATPPPSMLVAWEHTLTKGVECLVLSKAHRMLLLLGGWDGTVRLYDAETGQAVTVLTQHRNASISSISSFDTSSSSSAAVSTQGARTAAAGGQQCFWSSARAPRGDGRALPDVFAAGASDGMISIWAPLVVRRAENDEAAAKCLKDAKALTACLPQID